MPTSVAKRRPKSFYLLLFAKRTYPLESDSTMHIALRWMITLRVQSLPSFVQSAFQLFAQLAVSRGRVLGKLPQRFLAISGPAFHRLT